MKSTNYGNHIDNEIFRSLTLREKTKILIKSFFCLNDIMEGIIFSFICIYRNMLFGF